MNKYAFKLPDLGEGVVEAEIIAWHVEAGDVVYEDQPLVEVMTDKATVTIPSAVSGVVLGTNGQVGQSVAVGTELVEFEISAVPSTAHAAAVHVAAGKTQVGSGLTGSVASIPEAPSVAFASRDAANGTSPDAPSAKSLASPAVRRRAREKGVDLALVTGSGRGGRIIDSDVDNFLRTGVAQHNGHEFGRTRRTGTTEIHLAGLRRQIAEKMSVSASHIPHFSYVEQVDITELAELRRFMNQRRSSDEAKLSYLPFIMLALVHAFRKHPQVNARYDEQREVVTRFDAAHLGIATQTERGLYVPVIRHVEALDLWEAARELRRVTQAAHHNTVKREELIGSTFTITSLGAMGGLAATPIINYPEVAILGVHKAYDRPVVIDGQVVVRHMVNLSASFDHRVVDGSDGAMLIQTLKDYLEHPALIFL